MDSSTRPHMRSYQACRACRTRKIRCDRGPVDNPDPPPCARCRRESKECVFSSTRRRRRQNSDATEEDNPVAGSNGGVGGAGESSDQDVHGSSHSHGNRVHGYNGIGHKRPRSDHLDDDLNRSNHGDPSAAGSAGVTSQLHHSSAPSTLTSTQFGHGMVGVRQRRNSRPTPPYDEEDEKKASNKATAMLQTSEVFSGHDALNLLFEAAGQNGDIVHHRTGSGGSLPVPNFATVNTPGSYSTLQSPQVNVAGGGRMNTPGREAPSSHAPVDPAIGTNYASGMNDLEESRAYEDAIRGWSRFRFVRAGWFTAKEGIAYIDYFYQYLSPLTPIVVQDFQNHSLHERLLLEEPMLVITMLTIASRYMKLSGPGATSRPFSIHQQLWQYLLGMVQRVVFSQEQFGGGFCGAGAPQRNGNGHDNSLYRKGLRTLGTIESLLLLTEWHPRALHFPPGDDSDELMMSDDIFSTHANGRDPFMDEGSSLKFGTSGPRVDSCMEPCWRSDRMTWMLLGNALTLAFELGVFDEINEIDFQEENPSFSFIDVQTVFQRRQNLRELLLIYITQTSGRLGLNTILPKRYMDPYFSKTPEQRLRERMERLQNSALSNGTHEAHKRQLTTRDLVLYFWVEIAALFESGNQRLFQSRRYTREIITTGQYKEMLQYFQPILQQWRRTFDEATGSEQLVEKTLLPDLLMNSLVPTLMRHVLMIEYEYSRVYINSLALQAIVERCTNNTPTRTKQMSFEGGATRSESKAIPFATLMRWYGDDRKYISEVTSGARNVLRVVVEGLYPNEYLKHAPVRTYFRIISVAIILLKTFALGATEDDVAISLGLMDRAVDAVRTCIVDDVHVGIRFADLLETLSSRIRSSFVRMSSSNSLTGMPLSRAQSHSPGLTAAAMAMAPMGPPPVPTNSGNMNNNSSNSALLTAPLSSNWPNNANANIGISGPFSFISPNSPSLTAGRMTPSHPLYGISTEPYDPGTGNVSIMPPPFFPINGPGALSSNIYDSDNPTSGGGGGGGGMNVIGTPGATGLTDDGSTTGGVPSSQGGAGPDWLALPLDPLLNSYGADVTQTTYGPDVGGFDLLDLLLGN